MPFNNSGMFVPENGPSPMERLYNFQKTQDAMRRLQAQRDLEEQRRKILAESYTPGQAAVEASGPAAYSPDANPADFAGQLVARRVEAQEAKPAQFDAEGAINRLFAIGDVEGANSLAAAQEKQSRDLNRWSGAVTYIDDPDNPGATIAVQPSTQGTGEPYRKIGVASMTPEARARLEAMRRKEAYERSKDARDYQFDREKFDFQKTTSGQSSQQPSEDERKAAGWVAQARTSLANMQDALTQDPSADSPSAGEKVAGVFGAEGAFQSEARQRYATAAASFAEAALRAATGAGVNEQEAKQKINELTPTYFDKPATKAQKWRQLEMYLNSLETRAGRALQSVNVPSPVGKPQAAPARPSAPSPKAKPAAYREYEDAIRKAGGDQRKIEAINARARQMGII